MGGDEFVVLLSSSPEGSDSIPTVVKRLLSSISEVPFGKDKEHSLSISVGIAYFDKDTINLSDLLTIADKRMYRAKDKGGNLAYDGKDFISG